MPSNALTFCQTHRDNTMTWHDCQIKALVIGMSTNMCQEDRSLSNTCVTCLTYNTRNLMERFRNFPLSHDRAGSCYHITKLMGVKRKDLSLGTLLPALQVECRWSGSYKRIRQAAVRGQARWAGLVAFECSRRSRKIPPVRSC